MKKFVFNPLVKDLIKKRNDFFPLKISSIYNSHNTPKSYLRNDPKLKNIHIDIIGNQHRSFTTKPSSDQHQPHETKSHQPELPPGIFPFKLQLDVRGYELDSFGHVNNAVYLSWFEHARWELIMVQDRNIDRALKQWFDDAVPVLRKADLDFLQEVKLGERVEVVIWPRSVSNSTFVFGGAVKM